MNQFVVVPIDELEVQLDRKIKSERRRVKRAEAKFSRDLADRNGTFALREAQIRNKYMPLIIDHWRKNRFANFFHHFSVWSKPLAYGKGIFSFWVQMDARQSHRLQREAPPWLEGLRQIGWIQVLSGEPSVRLNVRIDDLPKPVIVSRDWYNSLLHRRDAILAASEDVTQVVVSLAFAQALWGEKMASKWPISPLISG